MPLTSLMALVSALTMLASWGFVMQRRKQSISRGNQQVRYLERFFLCMGLFSFLLFLPHTLLGSRPDLFPIAMGWVYTLGHIPLYVALIQILMLTCSMVPALMRWKGLAVVLASLFAVFILVVNYFTMIRGTLPVYDAERHVTLFNATPLVGNSIAILAALCVFPAAVVITFNGLRTPSSRLRSLLLGGGLFVIMTAGPLHDTAKTWQLYTVADVVSIIGMVVLVSGVIYQYEARIGRVAVQTQS